MPIPTSRAGIFPQNSWSDTIIRRSNVSGLCLILDDEYVHGREKAILEPAQDAGVRLFQYRNKRGTRREVCETAYMLSLAVKERGGMLIINDHADIAKAVNADGVHLGQDDLDVAGARKLLGREYLIGISTHSRDQAIAAAADGADYIGFGPVFPTSTKNAGPAQGIDELTRIRAAVDIPVLAIGGITLGNAEEVMRSGADGIAVISAVLASRNVGAAAKEFVALLSNMLDTRSRKGGI